MYYYRCFVKSSRWNWQRDIDCYKQKEGSYEGSWEWNLPKGAQPLPLLYLTNDEKNLPSILEAWLPHLDLDSDTKIPTYLEEAVLKKIFNTDKVTLFYE